MWRSPFLLLRYSNSSQNLEIILFTKRARVLLLKMWRSLFQLLRYSNSPQKSRNHLIY
ncbi:MAG: hypothetical protein AB4062_19380 [Crocosphaera sp.]